MDSSDSLQLDEHLARLLAAYDQSIEGADASAPTIGVKEPGKLAPHTAHERPLTPVHGSQPNRGSLQEVLPDGDRPNPSWLPRPAITPPGGTHRIGRFELRRQLGKGGCGIVFLAYDPKLEREVALKIPRPEMLLSADARGRLIREALAAAEFDHPNLVPVYETGEIGPVCFIATAFCPGLTLGEWLDRQAFPVPVRQAARLMATVCEAVQHAHDRGVLHRDLKPNNVILQDVREDPHQVDPPPGSCQLRGDHFIPRIVDFGLAKLLERGGPSETATRQVLGTPKYMAPEQAQARHDDVGPAADVYALGVILYELLTGRAPYDGETDVEVLRQAIDGILTPPRRVRSEVPRDLEAICLKAMSRSPSRRYRTAIDLADDLRRFLDGKPTLARPLKWLGRSARWLRRNDQAVALAVVTAIAMMLLAFWLTSNYQTRQLRTDRDKALKEQSERVRLDQQGQYARNVRNAFLAWRAGDTTAAAAALDSAVRNARASGESPDFVHGYLGGLMEAQRQAIACPAGPVTALAASADGGRLASGHENGAIAVWNRSNGSLVGTTAAHERRVERLEFLGSNELLSSDGVGPDRRWLIDSAGGLAAGPPLAERHDLPPPGFPAVRLGDTLYRGGPDGVVRGWDASKEHALLSVEPLTATATSAAVSPDGSRFVLGTSQHRLILFATGRPQPEITPPPGTLERLNLSKDNTLSTLTVHDGIAFLWDMGTASPRERYRYRPVGDSATAAAGVDGVHLAVGDAQGKVTVINTASQSQLGPVDIGDGAGVKRLAMSEDGRLVAAVCGDRLVLHSMTEKAPRATLAADDGTIFRFVPDGSRLLVSRPGGVILVLATATGSEEHTLYGHAGQVTGMTVSPDGRILVSGGVTGEVRFWDIRVGQEAMSFHRHRGPVTALGFSSNGKMLITAGKEVAIWTLSNE